MSISFYFTCQGKTIQLPVNPESIAITRRGSNEKQEVIGTGEVSILRGAQLATASLECLLPGSDSFPFIVGRWKKPATYVRFFRQAMQNKQTVRMVVAGLDINIKMSVEFVEETHSTYNENGIQLKVDLQAHRGYSATPLPSTAQPIAPPTREGDKPAETTHTVLPGESFWAIAQKCLGDGKRYNEVAQLNGKTAASVIHPGDVLKLPAR